MASWVPDNLEMGIIAVMQDLKDKGFKLNPGVTQEFASNLATAESGRDINAVSPTGVGGPFQVTKPTAKSYGLNRDVPMENIKAGIMHLSGLMDQFGGDKAKSVLGYNLGARGLSNLPPNTIPPHLNKYLRTAVGEDLVKNYSVGGQAGGSALTPDAGATEAPDQKTSKFKQLLPLILSIGIPGVLGAATGGGSLLGPLGGFAMGAGGGAKAYTDTKFKNELLDYQQKQGMLDFNRKLRSDLSLDNYRKGRLVALKAGGSGRDVEKNTYNKLWESIADVTNNQPITDLDEFRKITQAQDVEPIKEGRLWDSLDEDTLQAMMDFYNQYLQNKRGVKTSNVTGPQTVGDIPYTIRKKD